VVAPSLCSVVNLLGTRSSGQARRAPPRARVDRIRWSYVVCGESRHRRTAGGGEGRRRTRGEGERSDRERATARPSDHHAEKTLNVRAVNTTASKRVVLRCIRYVSGVSAYVARWSRPAVIDHIRIEPAPVSVKCRQGRRGSFSALWLGLSVAVFQPPYGGPEACSMRHIYLRPQDSAIVRGVAPDVKRARSVVAPGVIGMGKATALIA